MLWICREAGRRPEGGLLYEDLLASTANLAQPPSINGAPTPSASADASQASGAASATVDLTKEESSDIPGFMGLSQSLSPASDAPEQLVGCKQALAAPAATSHTDAQDMQTAAASAQRVAGKKRSLVADGHIASNR